MKENHPDKNVDCDEELKKSKEETFKKILEAYKTVAEYVIENNKSDSNDEEENRARDEFRESNIIQINARSVTVKIPSDQSNDWETVLADGYGNPIYRSANNNGKQFKTSEGLSITIW